MNGLFRPEWSTLKKLMFLQSMGGETWSTITGNPVSFTAKAAPLRQLSVAFSPVQEGSGDPSPDNVRPISGWDSLNVWQTGKNLIDWEHPFRLSSWYYGTSVGATIAPLIGTDPTMTASGNELTVTITDSWHGVTFRSPDLPNGNYRLSYKVDGTGLTGDRGRDAFAVDKNNKVLRVLAHSAWIGDTALSFTLSGDEVAIAVSMGARTGGSGTLKITNALLEQGSTTSDWEAPNVRSISISLGSTIYRGTVDVVTGVVTVTHKVYNLQNVRQDRILAYDSGGKHGVYFQYALDHAGTRMQGVCNMAVVDTGSSSSLPSYMWFGVNSANVFWVGILDVLGLADVSAFKTWLASNEVWICYPMKTPTEIQLTPQEVSSLLGENNMFSDANGDLTVEYRSN